MRQRGSAFEARPGVWQLRAPVAADATGKPGKRCKTVTGPASKNGTVPREIQRALADWVREIDGLQIVGPLHTYRELAARWLELGGLESSTRYGYEGYLKRYIFPVLGDKKVSAITVADLDAFYLRLRDQGYSPRTIHQAHAILRSSLAKAASWGWATFNVAAQTSPRTKGSVTKAVEAPTPDEVRAFRAACGAHDPLLELFVVLSAALGTRRGETCALRWDDWDCQEMTIHVHAALSKVSGQALESKATKTGAEGTLSIPEQVNDMLQLAWSRAAGRAPTLLTGQSYIFTDDVAGRAPWLPDSISHRVGVIRRAAGLPSRVTLKNLRHYHATQLLAAGVDLGTVAARLRHTDPSTTMRFYVKKDAAADRRAASAVEGIL